MSECPHGLDERDCATCKHGPEQPERVSVVATFSARFDGDCGECNLPISAGQTIHKLSNERYVHAGCVF